MVLVVLFFLSKFLRSGIYTIHEYLEDRYSTARVPSRLRDGGVYCGFISVRDGGEKGTPAAAIGAMILGVPVYGLLLLPEVTVLYHMAIMFLLLIAYVAAVPMPTSLINCFRSQVCDTVGPARLGLL